MQDSKRREKTQIVFKMKTVQNSVIFSTYLVHTHHLHIMENRSNEMCGNERSQSVANRHDPVHNAIVVQLDWITQKCNGRKRSDEHGNGYRKDGHLSPSHEEMLGRVSLLSAIHNGVIYTHCA